MQKMFAFTLLNTMVKFESLSNQTVKYYSKFMVVSVQTKFELRIGSNHLFEIIALFLQLRKEKLFFLSCSNFFVKMHKFANSLDTHTQKVKLHWHGRKHKNCILPRNFIEIFFLLKALLLYLECTQCVQFGILYIVLYTSKIFKIFLTKQLFELYLNFFLAQRNKLANFMQYRNIWNIKSDKFRVL